MFAKVLSATITGIEVCPVQVEADVSDGLPSFTMVGLPSTQVKEAQDRVRTALKNHGLGLPPKRITVNLAPADIRKDGAGFDLPVAAAVLAATGILEPELLEGVMMTGEISLNGEIHGVSGILPIVLKAKEEGCRYCMVPYENLREGQMIQGIQVIGVKYLSEMLQYVREPETFTETTAENIVKKEDHLIDFCDIRGQYAVKRAVEIAVGGFHNILLIGPPGSGKTMIARRIPTIMPELTLGESMELMKIYSVAGMLPKEDPFIRKRPFRSPHHSSTAGALAGGGRNPRPGEITLAHRGVLFLDEMPEFSRRSLEILRQPLEDKVIHISRVYGTYVFPANFILCAAMNPCPCGYYPDMNQCRCTVGEISHYQRKISQPLLDRIDLCTEVSPVSFGDLSGKKEGESSEVIRKRVEKVREIQRKRFTDETIQFNGEMQGKQIEKFCVLTDEAEELMKKAFSKLKYSARSYHKILKVARTIADMEESECIESSHVGEALSYRALDKKYWG